MYYRRIDTFRLTYRVFSFASRQPNKQKQMDVGGKIFLPPSTLASMASLNLVYPLTFRVNKHRNNNIITHCGVLEFTANEGECIAPQWLMKRLNLVDGDYIDLQTVNLPKAKFIRLKPLAFDFFKIPNYRVVMEKELRNYSTLTTGDIISISFNNKEYQLEVAECKPEGKAVSVVETDVLVDFDGNDFAENAPTQQDNSSDEEKDIGFCFGGTTEEIKKEEVSDDSEEFKPFSGVGHSLSESAELNQKKWLDDGW
ncbi:ubiquitin fusion degradation family protein [Entamoeba histolytica KU27]|uniref:Ubiquitin fusion degradation family protein n=1 Tax=Entamoeba histolytica KU27 TaxID=885311 RepID=M2RIU3_ENTHI|nr:ubiquitin fusion degradation family protein [Entamoeba histolytica KU27]